MRFRAPGLSSAILLVTVIYLVSGVAAFVSWRTTGSDGWVSGFFKVPGALLALWLAGVELLFSARARLCFNPGVPLRTAWTLIACSAACNLYGVLSIQVLAAETALNPLRAFVFWSNDAAVVIRETGLVVGSTIRYVLLAIALLYPVKVYRQSRLLARFRLLDHAALAVMGGYVTYELLEVLSSVQRGKQPAAIEIAGWPVDPLLWFLLAEALLLRRSAAQMGGGLIARCWQSMGIGIMLVALGDISLLATRMGYLSWPRSAVEWYVWIPAGAAFALAPAYQVEAVVFALTGERPAAFPGT